MARTITYIPTASDGSATANLPVDEIPDDVKAEVEEVYAALKANPNGRMRAQFDTKVELHQYITQATSYCRQRVDAEGNPAPLRFRKSPTKNLPETAMDFRISDPLPDNGTEGIRSAAKAANAAATAAETPAATPATPAKKAAAKAK